MRILHTADWHLGVFTGPASRVDEQQLFLTWLLETLRAREVDALVVAGDVFDSMHPAAEAQALYYRFLAQVAATGVRDIVIVGGNHDSASRLDAPRAVLEALGVHVLGGLPPADERLDRVVAPLRARGGEDIAAACLAIPYVHEYRLGIRTTELDRARTRAAFREAFSSLYRTAADAAQARYPGVPLLATGHLTLGGGTTRADYPQEIHQVGTLEGLPVEILDPRLSYVALGHIHRSYPIAGSKAWYAGSPIPYSLNEMAVQRQVLLVDLAPDGGAQVTPVAVPRQRDLIAVAGPPDDVVAAVAALTWTTPLPPLVYVWAHTQLAEPGLTRRLHEAVAAHPGPARPVLIDVQQRPPAPLDGSDPSRDEGADPAPSLADLSPGDVFALLCDAKGLDGAPRDQLEAAFAQIASASPEVLAALIAAIDGPPDAQAAAPGEAP